MSLAFLGVKIPQELADQIKDDAKARQTTKSQIVREVLAAYYGIDRTDHERAKLISLIDERIEFYLSKTTVKQGKTEVKPSVKQSKTIVKPTPGAQEAPTEPDVIAVLKLIKAHHDRGEEPTVEQIAQEARIESRPLGRLMKEAGVQAKSTKRGGVPARYYTLELRERIEEILRGA
jgi:hypothetical protein